MSTPPKTPSASAKAATGATKAATTTPPKPPTAAPVKAETVPAGATKAPATTTPPPVPPVKSSAAPAPAGSSLDWLTKNWDEEQQLNALLSGEHFTSNPVNGFYNLTYDFKLYCMPPRDYLSEIQGSSIRDFYSRLDSYPQFIIADTGVTNFNITEVQIVSTMQGVDTNATGITMKIVEPNGVAFFDALAEAADSAGIENYHDFYYFLELGFKGYDLDGEINNNPFASDPDKGGLDNGGRWVWGVRITNIAASLGTGGGEYTLTLFPAEQQATDLNGEYGQLLDNLIVKGESIGDFVDDFAKKLNKSWSDRLIDDDIVTHKFEFHAIPIPENVPSHDEAAMNKGHRLREGAETLYTGADALRSKRTDEEFVKYKDAALGRVAQAKGRIETANNKLEAVDEIDKVAVFSRADQVRTLSMRPQDEDFKDQRSADIEAPKDAPTEGISNEPIDPKNPKATIPTGHFPMGAMVSDVIKTIFSSCENLQCLAKDSSSDNLSPDDSPEKVNDEGHRQPITWDCLPEMRLNGDYDEITRRYHRHITWHLYPRISQHVILSALQIDESKKEEVQKRMVSALAARGFLPKRYDYLYTGLNTEVIDFNLNFDMSWSVTLPAMANFYEEQTVAQARFTPYKASDAGSILQRNAAAITAKEKEHDNFLNAQTKIVAQFNKGEITRAEATQRIEEARKLSKAAQKTAFDTGQLAKAARANFQSEKRPQLQQDYSRHYVEDILDADKDGNRAKELGQNQISRISLSVAGVQEDKNATGAGMVGQYHSGKNIYGAVLNQVYGLANVGFSNIEMKIKGDPFWIGRGSFETALAHQRENVDGKYIMNPLNGNVCALIEFKYPSDISEDGSIELKNNNVVSGIYAITEVTSSFSGGTFTQTLKGFRQTLFNYSVAMSNVNTSSLEETPLAVPPVPPTPPVVIDKATLPAWQAVAKARNEAQSPNVAVKGISGIQDSVWTNGFGGPLKSGPNSNDSKFKSWKGDISPFLKK